MHTSIFPTLRADVVQQNDFDWSVIVAMCQSPQTYPTKQACPLIKLASFGDKLSPVRVDADGRKRGGVLRHAANMLEVSGVELDYDAEQMQPAAAAAMLQLYGITAVVYTSPSHTATAPRWRVLAPLSRAYPPEARREFVARINAVLGGVCADESYVMAQAFYIGRVAGAEYECHVAVGQPVDQLPNLPVVYPVERTHAPVVPVAPQAYRADPERERVALGRIERMLRDAAPGERHAVRLRAAKLAGGYVGGGVLTEQMVMDHLQRVSDDISDNGATTYTEQETLLDGFRTGQSAPITDVREALDTAAIGFGRGVSVASHSAPTATAITGSTLVLAHQAQQIFQGCVYVESLNMMLVQGGKMIDRQRFNARYGPYSFMLDDANTVKAKTPWEGFLNSQVTLLPRAHDICFRPELPAACVIRECGDILVNIWWPVETDRIEGDVTPFLDYMRRILPYERDRALLISYMAAMVQYPGRKFSWCPVVQGAKGNGKTLIGTSIERALGDRYCHRPNSADIGNKFTGWLQGKLAIIVEELSTHEKRELLETLKPLITNRRVEIQRKGADQATGDNRANFIMFVNEQGAMPVDEDERRYAIFHTAQQCYSDIVRDGMGGDYFPSLYAWADGGGYAHIAHYLATYAIPDEMNPATKLHRAPQTSSTGAAIAASLGPLEQELKEYIDANSTPGLMNGWVSSAAVKKVLEESRRTTSPTLRGRILRNLGYVVHPNLPEGRTSAPTFVDGCRPKLYVKKGSDHWKLHQHEQIVKNYQDSQISR